MYICIDNQCSDTGSGRIGIILPDPDLFQPNVKLNYNFPRKFKYNVQNMESYDTYDADEIKDKTM